MKFLKSQLNDAIQNISLNYVNFDELKTILANLKENRHTLIEQGGFVEITKCI